MPKPPSAYVPLDVNYLRDRDIRRAGPDAELLYLRALTYCKGSFSDGNIPEYDLPLVAVDLKSVQKRIDKLVEVGLWSITDEGWHVRGWSIWNETSDETSAKKARAAERQARKRDRDKNGQSRDSHADVTRDTPVTSRVSHRTKEEEEEEEEEEELASRRDAVQAVAQTRPRDQLWDAIVEVCGIEGTPTKSAAGEIANAKKQLTEVGAVPGQVGVRANRYRQRYPGATLTPSALAKHWSALGDSEPPQSRRVNPMNELSKANRP